MFWTNVWFQVSINRTHTNNLLLYLMEERSSHTNSTRRIWRLLSWFNIEGVSLEHVWSIHAISGREPLNGSGTGKFQNRLRGLITENVFSDFAVSFVKRQRLAYCYFIDNSVVNGQRNSWVQCLHLWLDIIQRSLFIRTNFANVSRYASKDF